MRRMTRFLTTLLRAILPAAALSICWGVWPAPCLGDEGDFERAFERFLAAQGAQAAREASDEVLATEPDFETVYARLRSGRVYEADVPKGLFFRSRNTLFHYAVLMPEVYDPSRRYEVRFLLHGGVGRPAWPENDGAWWKDYDSLKHPERIWIIPAAWRGARWWDKSQADNLVDILRQIKRRYNIDENRVSLLGISDGGTGAYFMAFRASTPWASFVSLIGHAAVLANKGTRADGDMYAVNLANRPLLAINGGEDPLYPSSSVRPWVEMYRRAGSEAILVDKSTSGHDLDWLPEEWERIDRFLAERPRDPLPDRVVWETELVDRYNRCHWLVITELGEVKGESDLPDVNALGEWFFSRHAFLRRSPSGRVEVERRGNLLEARTRGVRSFRLLLSPEEIDFDRPVTVRVNGVEAFQGIVRRDIATMLRWAAEDRDRTMLFAAELEIDVPSSP